MDSLIVAKLVAALEGNSTFIANIVGYINFNIPFNSTRHTLLLIGETAGTMRLLTRNMAACMLTLVLASCSTQKNTFMSRNYHNLTSYYNYYYNAYDSYRNGERRVYKDFKYNYTLPLPMLLFGERGVSDMVSSDMERTLNKCTALLAKHSITVKPKRKNGSLSSKEKEFYNRYEYVRWAQESWLLVGKAHTWKGDLSKAQMAFEYVIRQFPNTTTWYEAQVWLARVEILNGDFISAGDRLKSVDAKRRKPTDRQFNHLLSSTWAFYHLKQHNSNEAIPFIKRAAEFTNYKAERLRYTYLLAQLQQQLGNTTEAIELYDRVMRMGPPYEMAFSIRIQLIALSNMKGEDLKRELLKLASDEKNKDYLDQLYYTLGNMEKQEGNMDKAIEYYLLSARLSTTNDNQKGMSYLVLADHYFQKSEYAKAQAYYDSSFNSLDASFPGYAQLETKTRFLTNLVENLNIVSTEDSLQRVAAMSPKDRDALIASIIGKLQEEEQKLKAQEQADQMQSQIYMQNQRFRSNSEPQGGKWYFYNPASLSYGQSEFQMKWGKRKLEDNWRRKNKGVSDFENIASGGLPSDSAANPQKQLSNTSPEFYLVNLPFTDSLKQISNQKILTAMMRIAEIYQTDLNDSKAAKESYKKLSERFPDASEAATAIYRMYRIAADEGNSVEAEGYKIALLSRFPSSPYALILSNPEYIKELTVKENEANSIYETAYGLYLQGNFSEAAKTLKSGMGKVKGTDMEPKYLLLDALCQSKTGDLRTFKESLEQVALTFPKSEQGQVAQNLLTYLEQRDLQLSTGKVSIDVPVVSVSSDSISTSIYTKPEGEHAFVLLVPKRTNINQLKFNIITFNVDNFIEMDLALNSVPLNDFVEVVSVTGFQSADIALSYYKLITQDEKVFADFNRAEFQAFLFSTENFNRFMNDKSIPDYSRFFKENYSVDN